MQWINIGDKEPQEGKECIFLTGNLKTPVFKEFGTRYARVDGYAYTTQCKPHYWMYADVLPLRPKFT